MVVAQNETTIIIRISRVFIVTSLLHDSAISEKSMLKIDFSY